MARILVVDDAAFMRGSLKFILETAGHEVIGTGEDGKDALNLYKKLKPDLVTLDILMKGVDGLTALKNIMEYDNNAKVIMISALGMEDKQEEAGKLGSKGYIRKPFKQAEIVAEVERVLKGSSESGVRS